MSTYITNDWRRYPEFDAPVSNNGGQMFVDLASTQSFIKDDFKVVLSDSNAFDLINTIVYQVGLALSFPETFSEAAVTSTILAGIEKVMGMNIVRYTTHAIFEAAGITLEARQGDVLTVNQLTTLVHGPNNLRQYQAAAKKVWGYLCSTPEVMAKITASKKFCNLAIIACAIHRFSDDGHNWKSDHTEDPTKVAGRAVAVAGSEKHEFIEFMSRNGHDIWHYLSDRCLTRLAYILTTNMDYGRDLAQLPMGEGAMIERYGIELDANQPAAEARVNMAALHIALPDLEPVAEQDGDNTNQDGVDGADGAAADQQEDEPDDEDEDDDDGTDGDGDGDDDSGSQASAHSRRGVGTVKVTELIVVGQAAKDRFPPGTMGKSALITGVALAVAMIEHIARKVVVPNGAEIISSISTLSVFLASADLARDQLIAAKNAMSAQLAMAWGYCKELTELEQLANTYQSLVSFAQRYPAAVASGATLARMMKEVVADPSAVENAIVAALQSMSAMHASLEAVVNLGQPLPAYPNSGGVEIFRTTAQLSNEKERRNLEVEVDNI